MVHMILTGTADGLYEVSLAGEITRHALAGTEVRAVSGDWAIVDGVVRSLSGDRRLELPGGLVPRCLLGGSGGGCVVGTSEAHLFAADANGLQRVASFDEIAGREDWYTPWGGPPDTRSLSTGPKGMLVNVHVGGVWRAQGGSWAQAVSPDRDVHQVIAVESAVAVAAGGGVGQSLDGGISWTWSTAGLHAPYCRAVAIAGGWLLISASDGPGTQRGAVYRRPLDKPQADFVPCGGDGKLPKFFPYNVDTFELAAAGELVTVGTPAGELYLSEDAGASWRLPDSALPGVHCIDFVS